MKNTFYTAEQLREIVGFNADSIIDDILPAIVKEAMAGKDSILPHQHCSDTYKDFWYYAGYSSTNHNHSIWNKVAKEFRKMGYSFEFYYNDGAYFSDMYTIISWKK